MLGSIALALLTLAGPASRAGTPSERAYEYYKDGVANYEHERFDGALKSFEMTIGLARHTDENRLLGDALHYASSSALRLGQATPAVKHAKDYLEWVKAFGTPAADDARARNDLLEGYLALGTLDDAEALVRASEGTLSAAADREERARFAAVRAELAARKSSAGPAAREDPGVSGASGASSPRAPQGQDSRTPGAHDPTTVTGARAAMVAVPGRTVALEVGGKRIEVAVSAFEMDPTEVTNAAFAAFAEASGYATHGDWRGFAGEGHEREPVRGVTIEDAEAYAAFVGARLPTEAEWMAAAGGEAGAPYAFGDRFDATRGRLGLPPSAGPLAVASFAANALGLYDLTGNVREWCVPDPATATPGTKSAGDLRAAKGGSWRSDAQDARSDGRLRLPAGAGFPDVGFRCARDRTAN